MDVSFNIPNLNPNAAYTSILNILDESTVLLLFNCQGTFVERWDYKKNDPIPVKTETSSVTLMGNQLSFTPTGTTIPSGGSATFTFSPTTYTWTWQSATCGPVNSTANGAVVTLTACGATTSTAVYTFTVTDNLGCSTSQNVNINGGIVTGNGYNAYVASVKSSTCGANNGEAIIVAGGSGTIYSSSWDGGPYVSGTSTVGLSPGSHTVKVKNAVPLNNSQSVQIITLNFFIPIEPGTQPYIYAGPDYTVGRSCGFVLYATPLISGNTYKWFKGASTTPFALTPNTQASTWATDVFKVEVTTPGGCKNTDELTVNATAPGCYPFVKHNDNCPQNVPTEKSAGSSIENITTSQTISADQYINKTYKVHNNAVLTIANCELTFGPGTKIIVQPGGQLNIQNAFLHGCGFNFWEGIEVNGNYSDPNQLYIASSTITDANYPVKADKTIGLVIDNNFFISGIIAIDLDRNKDFSITSNSFYDYEVAINTTRTPVANVSSLIKENTFENVKRAIVLSNDNHTKLDIKCNKFKNYTEYAIYSDNTLLKDQGATATGAANTFTSSSTLINHQLRHNGNAMNYYYDPSNPVSLTTSSTLKATAQIAATNGPCYGEAVRMSGDIATNQSSASASEINFNACPNPFINQLTITYSLPVNSKNGTLKIFEAASGKEIFATGLTEGQNKIELTDFNIAAGMYICTLFAGDGSSKSFKLVNIK